jgi:DNA modification methylase
MKTTTLKQYSKNPRKISDKQFDELKQWLAELGDLSGIVHDINSNQVISGNQRTKVFSLKESDIVITEKYKKPTKTGTIALGYVIYNGEKFNYRQVKWSPKQCDKASIIANKAGGEWDEDKLAEFFSADDLSEWGFEADELDFYDDLEVKEDEFDPEAEYQKIITPQTKLNDLYDLNGHKLICGDAEAEETYKRLLQNKKARLIFTDPPYNVNYKSQAGNSYNAGKYGNNGKVFNDNKKPEECLKFYNNSLQNLFKYTTDDAVLYWWFAMNNHYLNREALINNGWHVSQVLIWVKEHFVFAHGQDYHRCYEPVMLCWKKGKKHFTNKKIGNLQDIFSLDFNDFAEQLDLWFIHRDNTNFYLHPTQKPVRLAERALKKNSSINDIVLDGFAGSGPTLIACEQLHRYCYMAELDPKYADVIVKRYIKFCSDNSLDCKIYKNSKSLDKHKFIAE